MEFVFFEDLYYFGGEIGLFVGDVYYYCLGWCQLGWEGFGVVFDEYVDEVFEGFEDCMVQYYWVFVVVVFGDVVGVQVFWQVWVVLQGVVLLVMVEVVFQGEFDFWFVECVFVWLVFLGQVGFVQCIGQCVFGVILQFVGIDVFGWMG